MTTIVQRMIGDVSRTKPWRAAWARALGVWAALALGFASPAAAQLSIAFDKYHAFDEMTAFLREAAQKYPDVARLYSIGKSYQGRDLWLLEISNRKTGSPDDKPALYLNGCLDSAEVVTSEGVLYSIKRFLEGYEKDPRITAIIDTRTLYIVPRIMPDNTELYLTTPHQARSVSAEPWDEDGDGKKDEDPDDDVNGDGYIVQMRVKDPNGQWKVSEKDPRLMVPRRAGELEGSFYRVLTEGTDSDGDGRYNEDRQGGVDPNRNYPGNWAPAHMQGGAGPYPLQVREVRAEVEFIDKHPNIAGYINHHSSGGVILRPSTTHDDSTIPAADLRTLRVIAAMALDATGYWLATSVYDWRYPPGSSDTKPGQTWRRPDGSLANDPRDAAAGFGPGAMGSAAALDPRLPVAGDAEHVVPTAEDDPRHAYYAYGGSIEATYELMGIISYASEQWRAAFDHDLDKNGSISDFERLSWNDKNFGGNLFINWTPFKHPQLGDVEIGGWKKYSTSSPPPGKYLEEESERQFKFNLLLAEMLPRVKVRDVTATPVGDGLFKIVAKIENAGYIATATEMHQKLRRIPQVTAALSGDVEVVDGSATKNVGHLSGAPSEGATAEWIVRAKGATPSVTVTASVVTGGRDAKSVTLPVKATAGKR